MAMTHIRILGGRSSKLMQTWLVVGTRIDVTAEQSAFKTKVFTPTRRSAGHFALFASRSVKARPCPCCLAAPARASRRGECLRTSTKAKRWKRSRCGERQYTANDLPPVLVATELAHAPAANRDLVTVVPDYVQEWTRAQRTCDVLGRLAAPETSKAMKIEQV